MKKIIKYASMLVLGIWLSMTYLRFADKLIGFVTADSISFSDQGVQFLVVMIVYIVIVFPGILILLKTISKKWEIW